MSSTRYYGLYRGTVSSNTDPMMLGRLQVGVSGISDAISQSWANPCVVFAASDKGLFALPPVGANVWVMFENGELDSPVWMGGFWDQSARPPASPAQETMKVFKTDGLTVKLSLGPAGITIDGGKGAKIELQGIKVSINGGALEVM